MAAYDISRNTFDPKKHYSSVRMQQGRVLIDDDWNENERIENEERRRSRLDIIGVHGSPDNGFLIDNPRTEDGYLNFDILAGTYHLGGLRLELEVDKKLNLQKKKQEKQQRFNPVNKIGETFRTQKDWLEGSPEPAPTLAEGEERYDLVYLEAWQQAVSAVEDCDLFEPALGGPDTTTRVRNMRRVRIVSVDNADCLQAWASLKDTFKEASAYRGEINKEHELVPKNTRLEVSFIQNGNTKDWCSQGVNSGYLGAENQAIRVQITKKNHFTWGFDNASSLYRITLDGDSKTVTMITQPKDQHHWPQAGQTVEILPWSAALPNNEKIAQISGHFTKVATSFTPSGQNSNTFTLEDAPPSGFGTKWKLRPDQDEIPSDKVPQEYFFLRVWDRGSDLSSDSEIAFMPDSNTPIPLGQTGLAISITSEEDNLVGDYHWTIAVRPETPEEVMPWILKEGMLPQGVRKFYAPLAIIHWWKEGGEIEGEVVTDCRNTFRPLTDLETCCDCLVGDGHYSMGVTNSLEDAIKSLPKEVGGKICLLPGIHNLNLEIVARKEIRISGCGPHTIVRPLPDKLEEPIFKISDSQSIQLDNLTMLAPNGPAIVVEDMGTGLSQNISILNNQIVTCKEAIQVRVSDSSGNNDIHIAGNKIGILNTDEGGVGIFVRADDVLIERNHIVVLPDTTPFNEVCDFKQMMSFSKIRGLLSDVFSQLKTIELYMGDKFYINEMKSLGGVQIGSSSERVRIVDNRIIGGKGNGITLGHIPEKGQEPEEFLDEVTIDNNRIYCMGLSGIGASAYVGDMMIIVEDLNIYRNTIMYCALQLPLKMVGNVGYGGISLSICENGIIRENRIEKNGKKNEVDPIDPICGIFIMIGENIDISDNRILDNGNLLLKDLQQNVRKGVRGGIVLTMGLMGLKHISENALSEIYYDGVPAIKVSNNIVTQPLGRALNFVLFGDGIVEGNQLTSKSIDLGNIGSLLAGTVSIINFGLPKDLLFVWIVWIFNILWDLRDSANMQQVTEKMDKRSTKAGSVFMDSIAIVDIDNIPDGTWSKLLKLFYYLPSGDVLLSNNQVTLDLRNWIPNPSLTSQLVASLGHIVYNNNQSNCYYFLGLADIVWTNTFLLGVSIVSNSNHFHEGHIPWLPFNSYSLYSLGYINTAIGNQSTHCMKIKGSLLSTNNNRSLHPCPG